jgi:hypothetical protein
MKITNIYLLDGLVVSIPGCSIESLKRTSYESLQNIGEMQCQKELSSECQKRESYDDYQKKRKIIESPQ